MRLSKLVETSELISSMRGRLDKARTLASLLEVATPEDVPLIVSYLSGQILQGRIGIGHQTLRAVQGASSQTTPALELSELDNAFGELTRMAGPGSSRREFENRWTWSISHQRV